MSTTKACNSPCFSEMRCRWQIMMPIGRVSDAWATMISAGCIDPDMLRRGGHALQLDRPRFGTLAGAAAVFCPDAGFSQRRGTTVPDPGGPGLYRLLWHDDIPVPALAVSAFLVAADDGPEGLPAGLDTGRGGFPAADTDDVEG